ncbi:11201_t:CDS:2 [Funneliformis geosporum]|uniref:DNA-directed DNA polymerase n=1 Tax=Funneliformis geosporum TaxID=1117311 RepID=A0A9W4WWJ7_9GLOM|nr:11201_t:CDS:2 [Funneliformis geosporum]
MGTWKPKKKNLCNNCFMRRMRERNERIPDPSERFSYVVVKGPPLYIKKGRKEPHRVGDFMEYADIAKEQNMEIDINYYLGTTIKDSDIREKQIDEYSQKKAKNWLIKYIKSLQ